MGKKISMRGRFYLELFRNGKSVHYEESDNTIMNLGLASVSGLILTDIGGTAFDNIAIGTGTTAPNATQSALVAETYRNAGTGSQITTSVANDTSRITTSVAITNSNVFTEAGIFDATSSGVMLARTTFSAITASNGDTVNVGYDVVFS